MIIFEEVRKYQIVVSDDFDETDQAKLADEVFFSPKKAELGLQRKYKTVMVRRIKDDNLKKE